MELSFELNGRPVEISYEPGESLLTVLRERLGLRSMKDGCAPEGSCGACTVIVEGKAAVSCAQPAERVAGKSVVTLEGLPEQVRSLWADALVGAGAVQCGYCTPGIVMKAEALLGRNASPSRDEFARSLAGNLCRCTGYAKVLDALETVAAVRAGAAPPPVLETSGAIGARTPRYEGRPAALGEQVFVRDMTAPGMLHGAVRLADHPRALVRRIDVTEASAMPGVRAVVTAADVPGTRYQGLLVSDWPVFVAEGEETRCAGDVLAAVAADTRAQARAAAEAIEIEYEVREPVLDPFEALADGAPRVQPAGNLLETSIVRHGDVDAALAAAAHVVTETFRTQRVEHAFLEPEACLVVPSVAEAEPEAEPGAEAEPAGSDAAASPFAGLSLRIYSQGQGVWEDRRQVASLLGLEEDAVRVTQVATGGGFGGKEDLAVQGQTALLAAVTKRPVHTALSRAESIRLHPKRHPVTMTYTVGADAEGRLVGLRARIVGDTGAYASVGHKVLERAAGHACGAYRVPAVDVESRTVYTNNPPAGAFRGFGVVQVTFAIEGILDRLAEAIGIDGWEIRWRNALESGDRFGTGQRLGPGVGLKQTLLAVRDAYRAAPYAGIACAVKNTGIGNGVTEFGKAVLRPEADGTISLYHSWTEMGQGVHTVLAQVAATELGLDPARIRVLVDTDHELDTGETTASRATALGGQAVLAAAANLRAALAEGASLAELAGCEFPGLYTVDWTSATTPDDPEPVTHFAYGWATQVVTLDADGRLERVVAAQDVGRVMNRSLLEGQVEGGVHMGLGMALSEDLPSPGGIPGPTLKELGIIPAASMPPVEVILVEEHQPEGPYGAKGAGEAVLVPTPAAVAAALYAYDGIRRTALPMRDSAAARAAVPRLARAARP